MCVCVCVCACACVSHRFRDSVRFSLLMFGFEAINICCDRRTKMYQRYEKRPVP